MVTKEILNTHTVTTLKKEIGKVKKEFTVTGKKKPELIQMMLKNRSLFSHIEPRVKAAIKRRSKAEIEKAKAETQKNKLNLNLKKLKVKEMSYGKSLKGTNYTYKDQNLHIEILTKGSTPTKPRDIFLALFTATDKADKPRAPKGLASRVLCQLIHLILKKGAGPKTPFDLDPVNLLGLEGSDKELVKFYKKLGFKRKKGMNEMTQPVDSFLKNCEKNGRLIDELSLN